MVASVRSTADMPRVAGKAARVVVPLVYGRTAAKKPFSQNVGASTSGLWRNAENTPRENNPKAIRARTLAYQIFCVAQPANPASSLPKNGCRPAHDV